MSNPIDMIQKPMGTEGDELLTKPLRRKAGSGTRCTTQPTEIPSSGKRGLVPPMHNKIGAGSFLAAKHGMHQGIHHLKRKSNKALGDITGIILNNMKADPTV